MARRRFVVAASIAVLTLSGVFSAAADAKIPVLYSNCKHLNARYPHGVGRYGAHDKTAGIPVKNFFHSNLAYALAIRYNAGLDRDHDKIACEQS